MLRGFGAAPYPANLGILVSTAWVRMTARGFECLIKCLAQPQVIVSALTSGCLKVIQQTLVNLMQLALGAYGFCIVCTEHRGRQRSESVLPEWYKRRAIHPAFPLN